MAKKHPCEKGLTEECIRKYPEWAVKVFAYRLLNALLPKDITKNLPKFLIPPDYEGVEGAPLADIPPGFKTDVDSALCAPPDSGALPPENFSPLASTPAPGASSSPPGPTPVPVTKEYFVVAGADDGYLRAGDHVFFTDQPYDDFGSLDEYHGRMSAFLRIINFDVPSGKTIQNSFLTLKGHSGVFTGAINAKIYGNKKANPAAPVSEDEYLAMEETTGVAWDNVIWSLIDPNVSPNISSIIQELIGISGRVEGDAIILMIKDNLSDLGCYAEYFAFESGQETAQKLTVTYV